MKKFAYFVVLVCFYIINVAGFCSKTGDQDFVILEEKLGGGGNSAGCSDIDIAGNWEATLNCAATEKQKFYFYCDGTGYTNNPDCNNICVPGLQWDFSYTISGGVCYLDYPTQNTYVSCGTQVPPGNDASFTYSVSGNTLTTNFGTFYK